MKKIFITLLVALLSLEMMSAIVLNSEQISIIPEPVRLEQRTGVFLLNSDVDLVAVSAEEQQSARYFADYLQKHYGLSLPTVTKTGKNPSIVFAIKNAATPVVKGEYELTVGQKRVTLNGLNHPEGLFYAVQSLIQLIPAKGYWKLEIPAVYVYDKPAFGYRGMHLDVVRHIFPVEFIKKYIDYIALHKMNYFHWHLTDDQGWRIESMAYPKLNTIGAYRDGTIIGMFPGTGLDSTRYGGYYTVAQLREVVDYAKERYITVIPEVDIPAHCMAVIAAYPEMSTTPDSIRKPATTWGIYNRANNVLAPNEHTFRFLKAIFNEAIDIFYDSPYIHFGADEAARIWWKQSTESQEFMRKHNMKDEGEIQDYFVRMVVEVIKQRGKTAVGWDEILNDPNLDSDVIVMNWRGVRGGAIEAANRGHKVIMTPGRYSYLNYKQTPNEERTAHQRLALLDSIYLFNPVPAGVLPEAVKNIIGGQGCLWTEYYPTTSKVEYALFPRMSAIAENYWSGEERKDLDKFKRKLSKQFDRYDLWGTQYSTYVIETGDVRRR